MWISEWDPEFECFEVSVGRVFANSKCRVAPISFPDYEFGSTAWLAVCEVASGELMEEEYT